MKKEHLYFYASIVLFILGVLLGRSMNDTGRYFIKEYDGAFSVFDTKTSDHYYYDINSQQYLKQNVMNAEKPAKYKRKK